MPWVGDEVFHADTSVLPNGSGDTTYNYVQVFCFLMLALAATAVWTFLDRRRPNYARLHEWLRVYVRFALAVTMISYGAIKVIPSQFPSPDARPPPAAVRRRFADGPAVDLHGGLRRLHHLPRRLPRCSAGSSSSPAGPRCWAPW